MPTGFQTLFCCHGVLEDFSWIFWSVPWPLEPSLPSTLGSPRAFGVWLLIPHPSHHQQESGHLSDRPPPPRSAFAHVVPSCHYLLCILLPGHLWGPLFRGSGPLGPHSPACTELRVQPPAGQHASLASMAGLACPVAPGRVGPAPSLITGGAAPRPSMRTLCECPAGWSTWRRSCPRRAGSCGRAAPRASSRSVGRLTRCARRRTCC